MKKTLIVVGHPYWGGSTANKAIVDVLQGQCDNVTVSNLYELYGDGPIDVAAEQQKLVEADQIVLQFPIMWYSCPSLMHKWMEQILSYGFAYGVEGDKLKGKRLLASFTSASTADMYSVYGAQGMTIDDLMPAYPAISRYCGMQWMGYVYSGGMMLPANATEEMRQTLLSRAAFHAQRVIAILNS